MAEKNIFVCSFLSLNGSDFSLFFMKKLQPPHPQFGRRLNLHHPFPPLPPPARKRRGGGCTLWNDARTHMRPDLTFWRILKACSIGPTSKITCTEGRLEKR